MYLKKKKKLYFDLHRQTTYLNWIIKSYSDTQTVSIIHPNRNLYSMLKNATIKLWENYEIK